MEHAMFCYQCQETAGCTGCTRSGVCGKGPVLAAMQDLLVYVTKGLSAVTTALRAQGTAVDPAVDRLVVRNLFTTITNANFDESAVTACIREALDQTRRLRPLTAAALPEAACWNGQGDWREKAAGVGVLSTADEDIRSLRELITYGLKGLAAYLHHAGVLEARDGEIDAFRQRAQGYDLLFPPADDFACPGWCRIAFCTTTEQVEKALPVFEKLAKEYHLC